MEQHPLIRLFEALAPERFALLYGGTFPDEHTARFIGIGEEVLDHDGAEKGIRTRTAFVLVEAYQNVVRHRPGDGSARGCSFFFLHGANSTEVVTVNPVAEADLPDLRIALERVEGRTTEELKSLFLGSLQRGEQTKRGGAGLGLIEMARRSGHGLRHAFWPTTTHGQRFALRVRTGGGAEIGWNEDRPRTLDAWMASSGCVLLCAGSPSAAIMDMLLRVVGAEGTLGGDDLERVGMAAIELITALGPAAAPILIAWCVKDGERSLRLLVKEPHAPTTDLVALALELASYSPGEVHRRYRDALLGRTADAGPLGVGALDLARIAAEPMTVERVTATGLPYLSIHVRI
jgi:hypothetical protein